MLRSYLKVLFFLLILPFFVFGQDKVEEEKLIHMDMVNDTIGYYLSSNNPLIAKKYLLDISIYDYYFNPKEAILFLQMRDAYKSELYRRKGQVLAFDVNLGLGRWKRETDYTRSDFIFSEKYILKLRKTDAYCFDFSSGDIIWHSKDAIRLVDFKYDLILDASSRQIKAYNLIDKREIWRKKVKKVFDNNILYALPNHKILLSSYDVSFLDVENGTGNSFPVTIRKQVKKEEYYKFSTPKNFFAKPAVKSISNNENTVFFASMNKIYGININTEKKEWGTKLKKSLGTHYRIWIEGEAVYLLNYDKTSRSFPAFIAKYSINTGREIFFHIFKQDILDVKINGSEIACLLEDKVVTVDSMGEKNIFELRTIYGKPLSFVRKPIYEDRKTSLWKVFPEEESMFSVIFENTKVIILSDKLVQQNLNLSTVALELQSNKFIKLIKKGDIFFVLDKNLLERVKISRVGVPLLYKKTLLMMYDKYFYEVSPFVD